MHHPIGNPSDLVMVTNPFKTLLLLLLLLHPPLA